MKKLAQRIQLIAKENGITVAEVGRIAGATKSAAQQWVDGSTDKIGAEYALNLEDRLGYAFRWIVRGDGPKTTAEVRNEIAESYLGYAVNNHEILIIRDLSAKYRAVAEATVKALKDSNESDEDQGDVD